MVVQKIDVGCCIKGMNSLPEGQFNLIIADPPYNLSKDFGIWKEDEKRSQWKEWSREWLQAAHRVLSDRGNIFVYGIHHHQCWIQCIMYELGFQYRRQIIWHYENGFAGYGKRTLSASYKPLLWFSKTRDYIYHTIREPYKSQDRLKYKVSRTARLGALILMAGWQETSGTSRFLLASALNMSAWTIRHRSRYPFQGGW